MDGAFTHGVLLQARKAVLGARYLPSALSLKLCKSFKRLCLHKSTLLDKIASRHTRWRDRVPRSLTAGGWPPPSVHCGVNPLQKENANGWCFHSRGVGLGAFAGM